MNNTVQHSERRQTARAPARLAATLRSGDRECIGEILDLSRDGARVRVKETWDVGTATNLEIESFGCHAGAVVWSGEDTVGIKFKENCLLVTLLIGGWCQF